MTKRILIVISEWGYWGEELLGPLDHFDTAGYTTVFATPTGKRPQALPPSMDAGYVDPPLGRPVTTADVARRVRDLDTSDRLEAPRPLTGWVPERPYTSDADYLRKLEEYHRERERLDAEIAEQFDALLIVGGSGPIVDLANNERVHALVLGFLRTGRLIGAECYGVTALAFAREWDDRKSILWGKHVTGHCKEYDYKAGTGFLGTDFVIGPPPYPLEYILRDATGPDGAYHGNFGREGSVVVDWPFVTGRSNNDSFLTGEKMVAALEDGLTRYGW
ncbi:DJ-1/PfpI family protein [Myceligenerans halotolerans]